MSRRFWLGRKSKRNSFTQNCGPSWQVSQLEDRLMLAGDVGVEVAGAMTSSTSSLSSPVVCQSLHVVVNAWGQTGQERFRVLADEVEIGAFQAATTWTPFVIETQTEVPVERIRIEFLNDLYTPDVDRNLFVNNIQVNGVNYETASDQTFSTGTWTPVDGISPGNGRGIGLHANGYFEYSIDQPSAEHTLTVRARGDQGGEQFIVHYGDQSQTFSATIEFQDFVIATQSSLDASDVRIEFVNDRYDPAQGVDLNLVVDFIAIDGQVTQTESSSTFADGVWNGSQLTSGFLQTERLSGNGYFQFAAVGSSEIEVDASWGGLAGMPTGQSIDQIVTTTNGNVIVANDGYVTALDASGNRVSGFGSNGFVDLASLIDGFDPISTIVTDLDATPDGGILVTGSQFTFDSNNLDLTLLVKLTVDGQLDANFANGFRADLPIQTRTGDFLEPQSSVAADGTIFLAGESIASDPSARMRLGVIRLNGNGQADDADGQNAFVKVNARSNPLSPDADYEVLGIEQGPDGVIYTAVRRGDFTSVFRFDSELNLIPGIQSTESFLLDDFIAEEFAIRSDGQFDIFGYDLDSRATLVRGQFADGNVTVEQRLDLSEPVSLDGQSNLRFQQGYVSGLVTDQMGRTFIVQNQVARTGVNSYVNKGTLLVGVDANGELNTTLSFNGRALLGIASRGVLEVDDAGRLLIASGDIAESRTAPTAVTRWIV